jgi:DNA-binding PadR family transcriptional regulator
LLAALCDRPCSGYDLAKQFQGSVGYFWSATHQQIYRELHKLEDLGWISATAVSQDGRPDKKVFSVTPLGCDRLRQWISTPHDLPVTKDEILVKVFAGYLVPSSVLVGQLRHCQQQHQARLEVYQDIEAQFFQHLPPEPNHRHFAYLTLKRGISFTQEWIRWCEETIVWLEKYLS